MNKSKIRNFAIVAHIDHGKSTLADRLLEITQTIHKRDLKNQHMDNMDLERERGITIKLNAAQIEYKGYALHLIDTPGHVDFTYEVSRSLKACEGVLLLVDATQGIEAQTLANVYLALANNLTIIPVINKIDLASANPVQIKKEIAEQIGISTEHAIEISAKTGKNVSAILEALIKYVPPPKNSPDDNKSAVKALVFDCYYDSYRGVIMLVRIFNGSLQVGNKFKFMTTKNEFEITELGVKTPQEIKKTKLVEGEVGWIAASIRDAKKVAIGDTITLVDNPAISPLPGYKKLNSVVFAGFYPIDGRDYELLRESLERISLSDSSLIFEQETSEALGHGFRVGFLGMLHMEIIQERLDREFNAQVIATVPSVRFKVTKRNNDVLNVSNPALFPSPPQIKKIEEPYIKATIIVPNQFLGAVMDFCQEKRGKYINLEYLDNTRRQLQYELPLVEIIFDFFHRLKSLTKGYASFDYEFFEYKQTDLVKVDILLNSQQIDAFSFIVYRNYAIRRGREIVEKLKKVIPRHNFEIPIQAAIGGKIIARENIKSYRKDVTAKLYGGDRTRRDKLLKKQKAGKKRAREFGRVNVPNDAFIKVLKSDANQK